MSSSRKTIAIHRPQIKTLRPSALPIQALEKHITSADHSGFMCKMKLTLTHKDARRINVNSKFRHAAQSQLLRKLRQEGRELKISLANIVRTCLQKRKEILANFNRQFNIKLHGYYYSSLSEPLSVWSSPKPLECIHFSHKRKNELTISSVLHWLSAFCSTQTSYSLASSPQCQAAYKNYFLFAFLKFPAFPNMSPEVTMLIIQSQGWQLRRSSCQGCRGHPFAWEMVWSQGQVWINSGHPRLSQAGRNPHPQGSGFLWLR